MEVKEGGVELCNRLYTVRRDTYQKFGLKRGCGRKMAEGLQ